ncbi:hypothetical protein V8D89_005649 [Ganoderma adspersum]
MSKLCFLLLLSLCPLQVSLTGCILPSIITTSSVPLCLESSSPIASSWQKTHTTGAGEGDEVMTAMEDGSNGGQQQWRATVSTDEGNVGCKESDKGSSGREFGCLQRYVFFE